MARIVEQLTPLLISVNSPLQGPRRDPAHRPARRRPLGVDGVRVALLAGGTGGAKLGAGMQEEIGADLTVIANTGDDIEALGVHVSPDPDLVTYWLSGEIDEERGWGIRDDTFTVFERLTQLGAPDWFGLSDRDLAACLYRRQFLDDGGRLTDAQAQIARGARGRGAGAADVRRAGPDPGADRRRAARPAGVPDRRPRRARGRGVELEGIAEARADARGRSRRCARAEAIVIGPSNPVISIGPILAVPGMREAIAASGAPVVAVSPFVAGEVVKGPTERFMAAIGRPSTAAGVASLYAGLIDAMVVDEGDPDPPPAEIPTLARADPDGRAPPAAPALARIVLDYAADASRSSALKATAILPVKRFDAAKQRLAAGHRRRAPRGAGGGDARRRARGDRRGADDRAHDRRQRRPDRPGDRRRGRRRGRPRPGRRRATSRRRWPGSPAPRSRAPSASSCCPATARCSTRASSTAC